MNKTTEKLRQALSADLTDYAGIPFWSWNNEIEEEHLIKQIEEMHAVGMGGFIMHARIGLKTEYLGEKWFACIDACLKKAKELGMNAWVYDENGWPSGFVGGKMLEVEAYRAQFLEYEVKDTFDETAFGVYKKADKGYARIKSAEDGVKEYHCVYLRTSPANTDILNPEVVDEFIRQTHEEYYKRFKDSFGKELVGFFTDEPQYYRWATAYTRVAAPEYAKQFGGDIVDGLIYLFNNDEEGYEFRSRYYRLLNELYTVNFYKKIYDWCEEHNCKLTGHSIEECNLRGQMYGGAGVMPSYEYEHIPGIDCLGRNCPTEVMARQVANVAEQLGIKQVLTETYGCSGYDVTPQELKSIAEAQYFGGVNLMCHHLLPYSMAGQGKHDHPPVFSSQNNWYDEFKTFNDHFTRLGYIVANTSDNYDVAVVHPLRSTYLTYLRQDPERSTKEIDTDFAELVQTLRVNGIQYHFLDERILMRYGKTENGKLQVGKCSYDKIIVPKMKSISRETLDILKGYDGKLLMLSELSMVDGVKEKVDLQSNITFDEIVANAQVSFRSLDGKACMNSRKSELGDFIFIKNYSRTESAEISMKNVAENYKALDLETYELRDISNEYVIPKNESLILMRDDSAKDVKVEETVTAITDKFAVTGVTENYLVIDHASYSKDGENYTERMPLPKAFDQLLFEDYKGKVYLRHTFNVKSKTAMKLMMEKGRIFFTQLNGVDLKFEDSAFDINFMEADITSAVKEGENVFIYGVDYYQHDGVHFALFDPMATESVRNCLYYDTHIETVYVKGDFIVNEDHSIEKRTSLPALASDNYKNGYPFFMGSVTLDGEYDYDGNGERVLALNGRFITAELLINGKKTDITMDIRKNITKYLQVGKNKIQIVVKSSLRNLFGPHHFSYEAEPLGVSPICFTMRSTWVEGPSPLYTPVYNSVPFGVDEIQMISY